MPSQQVVFVENLTNPVSTVTVRSPSVTGLYVFSIADVPGVAAANTYISLMNPIGSGKTISFGGTFVSSTTAGGTTVTSPMRGIRITAASGGTLASATDIAKFVTADPNSVAQVRSGAAVSVTPVGNTFFFNSPPAISATVGSTAVHAVVNPPGSGAFLLVPGEGVAIQTASGDTDQRWNLSIAWGEI